MFRKINLSPNRIDWLLLALVLLAAAFFRFYRLADLPPGLVSDAALNGNDAWRLFNRGGHTLFLPGNGGREALFIYLQAIWVAVLGTTPLALRLPGALIDWLAVGLGFGFARLLFHTESRSLRRWIALWAGLALASSPWLVPISRLGFRAVLVPCVSVALFGALLLAWRRESLRWFIIAGVLLGLTGYTYFAAKILPVVLAAAILPEFWLGGFSSGHRRRRAGMLWLIASASLVYLPMLITLAGRPTPVNDRLTSVALWVFADSPGHFMALLWDSAIASAGFFCCRGNTELLLFGPGQPALSVGLGLLLPAGLVWALKRAAAIEWRLLSGWFLLGLLPGVLAIEAPHPLRLIAAAPPAIFLLAAGMFLLIRSGPERWRRWMAVILTLWLILSAALTFDSYFRRWPELPEIRTVFRTDLVELAQTVLAQTKAGLVVYLPRSLYAQPALRYYLTGALPPSASYSLPAESAAQVIVWAEPDETSWVRLGDGRATILPPLNRNTVDNLGDARVAVTMEGAKIARLEPERIFEAAVPPLKLTGATFPAIIPKNGMLDVTLWWEATARPHQDYQILVQLLGDGGQVWSLDDPISPAAGAYPAPYWRPGVDRVPDAHTLHLKESLPAGRYRLAVAVIDPISGKRLPVSAPASVSPDTLFIGPLKSPLPPVDEAGFTRIAPIRFAGVADLIGYRLTPDVVSGLPATVDLLWQAVGPIAVDYTVFVHLLNSAGELVGGHDAQPVNGVYPTGIWSAGEKIADLHPIDTGALLPGRYRLEVGLYNFATGERVPVDGSALLPRDLEIIGP